MDHETKPVLVIFSGLPGTGKSTLARQLARKLGYAYLRIDTIEQTIRHLCSLPIEGEGYQLAYRMAADNLKIGIPVIADSCNPIELTRNAWEAVACDCDADFVNIETCCSDKVEHRKRVETRTPTVAGLRHPTWAEVEAREYHCWTRARIVVNTFGKSINESFDELYGAISMLREQVAGQAIDPTRELPTPQKSISPVCCPED